MPLTDVNHAAAVQKFPIYAPGRAAEKGRLDPLPAAAANGRNRREGIIDLDAGDGRLSTQAV